MTAPAEPIGIDPEDFSGLQGQGSGGGAYILNAAGERVPLGITPAPITIRVRPASQDDIEHLLFACEEFSQFFGTTKPLFPDEAHARALLTELIATQAFFVARDERAFVGFIAGALAPHPYNPSIRLLSELFWWVDPNWRGTRAGLLLLEQFLAYGEQHADWIHFTLEAKSPVNERTLTRRGFQLYERAYLREVTR